MPCSNVMPLPTTSVMKLVSCLSTSISTPHTGELIVCKIKEVVRIESIADWIDD